MRLSMTRALLLLPLTLFAVACDDDTPTIPTLPTIVTVTETFSGQLTKNGAATHSYVAQSAGSTTASLTMLSPDSALVIGLSLGTWNGVTCQIILANDKATQAGTVTGVVSSAGNLCVRVYDVGNVTDPTSYEVRVTHP